MRRLAALLVAGILAAPAAAAERPARPRLCPDDLPEGAHLPAQPGCGAAPPAARAPRGDGFRDLGEGVSVRVGGRVGAEYGVRR